MKPHFIIVGAQRSGTTYLYDLLKNHPEICMACPGAPEPKYFVDKNNINLNTYHKIYFSHCLNSHKVLGEKSTCYYERKESAGLILGLLPEVKIIFLLRNPAYRAISNYFFSVNNGLENRSLKQVFIDDEPHPKINLNNISVNPFNYLKRGEYDIFIKHYLKFFPGEKIKIFIFEKFVNNIDNIKELYSFVGVDDKYIPPMINNKVNQSDRINEVPLEIISALKAHYEKPVQKLENLLNIDLSIWK